MRNFIIAVLVVATIIVGLGFYFGIATISGERTEEAVAVHLTVRTAPIQHFTGSVKHEANKLMDPMEASVGDLNESETVIGVVSELEPQSFMLITLENRAMRFQMDSTTKVIGSQLRGVRMGDRVTVTFRTTDGQHLARSISAD